MIAKRFQLLIGVVFVAFNLTGCSDEKGPTDAQSQFDLGLSYLKGQGEPKDFEEARKWFKKAADQGLADAQSRLGVEYLYGGGGMPIDEVEGIKWIKRAAVQGHAEAQYRLGLSYILGQGGLKDYVASYMWTSLSVAQGYEPFPEGSTASDSLKAIEGQLTDIELAKAKSLAREWKPTKE